MSSYVESEEIVHRGAWTVFKKIHWVSPDGRRRVWEAYERTQHNRGGRELDCVEILPLFHRVGFPTSVVLVSQFRPAAGTVTVEFPGGLVDEHETCIDAAIRELYEETGYRGIVSPSPCADSGSVVYNSGLSNTTGKMIVLHINGDAPENISAKPHPDEGEFTSVHVVPLVSLARKLKELHGLGLAIEARLYTFAAMMELYAPLPPKVAGDIGIDQPASAPSA